MTSEKQCRKCKQRKPIDGFNRDGRNQTDGRQAKCRECEAAYYATNKERILPRQNAYQRSHKEERKAAAAVYYQENVAAVTERVKRYRATPKGRAVACQTFAKEREEYPEKVAARKAVQKAIAQGNLVKGPCAECGITKNIQAHHPSYAPDRQLDVIWLCAKHHKALHMNQL